MVPGGGGWGDIIRKLVKSGVFFAEKSAYLENNGVFLGQKSVPQGYF